MTANNTTPRMFQQALLLGLGTGLLVELLSALPLIAWRLWREDSWELLLSIFVYPSPFLLLGLSLSGWPRDFRWCRLDLLYGAVTLLSLVSFWWIYRGFTPFNPIYTVLSSLALYLTFRMAWQAWLRRYLRQVVFFVFGLVSVEAGHGLVGIALDLESDTHMLNRNFLGMLCALTVPLWLVLLRDGAHRRGGRALHILFWTSSCLLLAALVVTNCRSAWLAMILVVPLVILAAWWPDYLTAPLRWPLWLKSSSLAGGVAVIIPVVWGLYQIRPASAQGRLLLWRTSLSIFYDHPGLGVGFRQLPHYLGIYHARFFEQEAPSADQLMLPSLFFDSFNAYLGVAAEYGLVGLALWIPLWVLILRVAGAPIARASGLKWSFQEPPAEEFLHPFVLGLSGLVLVYMVLSCFYFPGEILVLSVLFLFSLAGLATEAGAFGTRGTGE